MSLYILDTDHVTLHQHLHPALMANLQKHESGLIAVSIVTVEEQFRGRMAQLSGSDRLTIAYQQFMSTVYYFCGLTLLPFDDDAQALYQQLRTEKLRIGSLDMRIGAIARVRDATLVTRNRQDFERIPQLRWRLDFITDCTS